MTIPIIDVGGLRSSQLSDRQKVAAEMSQACRKVGFFYIKNHGIPDATLAQTFAEAKRFFDLSLAAKVEVATAKSKISRGYDPLRTQTLDLNARPDLNESFYIGLERGQDDPLVQAGLPNHGANQWPQDLPGWQTRMEHYFARMMELAQQLSQGLALSLDLDEHYFDAMTDNPMPVLRLLHYPPHPIAAEADEFGCGAHTDWGFLTILLQDQTGGLEVLTAAGDWVKAEPIPGTFVINLGDMLARWTNQMYRSTLHRVINRSGIERYSIPFFWDINYDAIVECLPTCCSPAHPPKYAAIQAGEHIAEMYQKTYGYV